MEPSSGASSASFQSALSDEDEDEDDLSSAAPSGASLPIGLSTIQKDFENLKRKN